MAPRADVHRHVCTACNMLSAVGPDDAPARRLRHQAARVQPHYKTALLYAHGHAHSDGVEAVTPGVHKSVVRPVRRCSPV